MKKAFALLMVFLPVLAVYASPIPGFDLGTFIVLIFGLVCVTFANKTSKVKMPIALLLVLVCLVHPPDLHCPALSATQPPSSGIGVLPM